MIVERDMISRIAYHNSFKYLKFNIAKLVLITFALDIIKEFHATIYF